MKRWEKISEPNFETIIHAILKHSGRSTPKSIQKILFKGLMLYRGGNRAKSVRIKLETLIEISDWLQARLRRTVLKYHNKLSATEIADFLSVQLEGERAIAVEPRRILTIEEEMVREKLINIKDIVKGKKGGSKRPGLGINSVKPKDKYKKPSASIIKNNRRPMHF